METVVMEHEVHKSAAVRQAEVDAAHLVRLLATAVDLGLMTSTGKPDADAANAILDRGELDGFTPRHDLLEPAKLLVKFADLRKPRECKLGEPVDGVGITIRLREVARDSLTEFTPVAAVLEKSARTHTPDIAWSQEGLVVRLESHFYLLDVREFFSVVADAYGLPLQKPKRSEPSPRTQDPFGGQFRFGPSDGQ